ncbi:DNA-binding protein [Floridanema aerugineum]|uniref:DNA-binding protein n=1 Tax=Floridaenema aerugineum BLCC-F46 TaxID=3153654 RepID=A0ABV4X2U2_9CYAN
MTRSTNYYDDLIESFKKSPSDAAMYLEVVIEEGNPQMLRLALKNVIEAHGGVHELSEAAKLQYEKLDFALSESGCPELYNLASLLDTMGFHLAVTLKPNQ